MDRLLLTTTPGLEPVAADELREEHCADAVRVGPGLIAVDVASARLATRVRDLNAGMACVDRVGVWLCEASVATLDSIRDAAHGAEYERWIEPGAAFAVRATRAGDHPFGSLEVAAAVGTAVGDTVEERRGRRPAVDLERPDVIFRADLRGDRLWIWLDTTGDIPLHHRGWREYNHMASMRPSVAHLLLRLSGWRDEPLIDPFCGGGTIPIEAACRAAGRPPASLRGESWAWQRLPELGGTGRSNVALGAVGCPRPAVADSSVAPIVGIERFRHHHQGALRNARAAGIAERVTLIRGRAERLDRALRRGTTEGGHLVTNPPFGRRVSRPQEAVGSYRGAMEAAASAGIATVTTLTELREPMREALESAGFRIAQEVSAVYGATPVGVFVATRP